MTKEKNKKEIEKVSIHNQFVIAETIYDYVLYKSFYIVKEKNNDYIYQKNRIEINGIVYKPFSSKNELLNKGILTLPTGLEDYQSKKELVNEIKDFIHSYVDVSEEFEIVSAYYILMTWVYDIFDNVGYLRVRGNPGNGKSRFLDVMNAISYKSTFFRVNPTEAVIFRVLDDTRGTVIIDEADYRHTEKSSGIVKLLNNGFARGSSISRNKSKKDGGYEIESFEIFSPKIIANRDYFKDDALESRCLTEYMGGKEIRKDVLKKLDLEFKNRASSLRNKLLKFRLENLEKIIPVNSNEIEFNLTPRSKQIGIPLFTLMEKKDYPFLEKVLKNTENNLSSIRNDFYESDILRFIKKSIENKKDKVGVKEITGFINQNSESWEKVSNRKIGSILNNLNIKKTRGGKNGNFIISISENKKQIQFLFKHYNI